MWWFQQGLCFLPVFLVVWSSSTFIVSYLIALFRHDVDVIFPYIRYVFFLFVHLFFFLNIREALFVVRSASFQVRKRVWVFLFFIFWDF